jgi:hypothetical protein
MFVEFKTTSNMACIGRRRNAYNATHIKIERMRPLGSSCCRCKNNIKLRPKNRTQMCKLD